MVHVYVHNQTTRQRFSLFRRIGYDSSVDSSTADGSIPSFASSSSSLWLQFTIKCCLKFPKRKFRRRSLRMRLYIEKTRSTLQEVTGQYLNDAICDGPSFSMYSFPMLKLTVFVRRQRTMAVFIISHFNINRTVKVKRANVNNT